MPGTPRKLASAVMGVALSALASSTFPEVLVAQYTPPTTRAVRLDGDQTIRLDGLLDEPAWASASPASGLRQREPNESAPATERTEVQVVFDGVTLYVGVSAFDTEPQEVISRILQRDRVMSQDQFFRQPLFGGDDAVAILLDPFHDHRNAVVFATNANGAEFDALITDEGREFNIDWRGVWRVRARRTASGWSAEFAIPFRSLRYPPEASVEGWGFNVYRMIRRKNEEALWSSWSRSGEGFERVSRAGHLEGLTNLPRPSLNLEVKPNILSGVTQEADSVGLQTADLRLEPGGDVKYQVTPGLVLDVTVNTDFAQVEVDNEQVNLTRFSLFFPEKRDFFLENSGIFEFGFRDGREPPPFLMFFSRRIGIHKDGEVPIVGGVRLTGRAGKQTIGLLNVVTDAAFDEEATNYAVARVKRDIGGASYIGAMATDRRSKDEWNLAGGVDFSWWPSNRLNLQGFAARTSTSAPGGEDYSYRLAAVYNSSVFGLTASHLFVGPDATADVGFVTRTDIRRSETFIRFTPRPRVLGLRKVDLFINVVHIANERWQTQDWTTRLIVSPQWNSGEGFTVFAVPSATRFDEGFDLTDDVSVPPGGYDNGRIGFFANTSANRPIVVNANGVLQQFFGGRLYAITGSVTAAPDRHVSFSLSFTHNDVATPQGGFRADISSFRLGLALSTQLFANALVQYNSLDNVISANLRINFIHRPGSDLFIVFNEQRGMESGSIWDFQSRGAVVKLTYLARI